MNIKIIISIIIISIIFLGLGWVLKTTQKEIPTTTPLKISETKPGIPIDDSWYKEQAIKNNDPSLCEKIKNIDVKDDCYLIIAQQTKDISLCEKITKESIKASCIDTLKEIPENNILITHTKENNKNTLLFEINFENYSLKSVDLSQYGPNFSQYGSQMIVPPKFNFSPKFPFLRIGTFTGGDSCEPEIPGLKIEVSLPLSSETKAELVDFKEKKVKKRLEIVPTIPCRSGGIGCLPCPNYLKKDKFRPPNFFVWPDESRFEAKEILRVELPLFRHNPATRETYRIEKAKIKVDYTVKSNLLLVEEEKVPRKVNVGEKFNVGYRIINLYSEKIRDLALKIKIEDSFGNIVGSGTSEKFDLDPFQSKIISVKGITSPSEGSCLLIPVILRKGVIRGAGDMTWISFFLPLKFDAWTLAEILTSEDFLFAEVKNNGKEPARVDVYFDILDQHDMEICSTYGKPSTLKPGEKKVFKAPPSCILTSCQKGGCTAIAYAEVKYSSFKKQWLGPIYLENLKGFMPSYCETDDDCVCCDSTEIDPPYSKNQCVNKYYAKKYNCKQGEFCSTHTCYCSEHLECEELERQK